MHWFVNNFECLNDSQKFLVILACIAAVSADVSHMPKKDYLPPTSGPATTPATTTTTTAKPIAASLDQNSFASISAPLSPSISTYSSFGVRSFDTHRKFQLELSPTTSSQSACSSQGLQIVQPWLEYSLWQLAVGKISSWNFLYVSMKYSMFDSCDRKVFRKWIFSKTMLLINLLCICILISIYRHCLFLRRCHHLR